MLIFGTSRKTLKEQGKVVQETSSSRKQLLLVFELWEHLDADGSGRVDISEFRAFVEGLVRTTQELSWHKRLPEETYVPLGLYGLTTTEERTRLAARVCDRVQATLTKKCVFLIEDLLRMIWPCAGVPELRRMKVWCDEMARSNVKLRIAEPKALSPDEQDALKAVYRHYDRDGNGASVEALIQGGLLDAEHRHKVRDQDGGYRGITLPEFMQLMCPAGFRTHEDARSAVAECGRRIVHDERLGAWRFDDSLGIVGQGWTTTHPKATAWGAGADRVSRPREPAG